VSCSKHNNWLVHAQVRSRNHAFISDAINAFGAPPAAGDHPHRYLSRVRCEGKFDAAAWAILRYHHLLASLADSEGRLPVTLTARSQRDPPWVRHQRKPQASPSVAVSEVLVALAGRT